MPTEQANIVPGEIIEGKVQGITNFGAFIELAGGIVGLVHISEIADTYVKDVRDFIQVGEQVKVKVLNVSGNKIGLSIKQATPSSKTVEVKPDRIKRPNPNYNRRTAFGQDQRVKNEPMSLDDKTAPTYFGNISSILSHPIDRFHLLSSPGPTIATLSIL
jgi:S1 RNA binding domain protein